MGGSLVAGISRLQRRELESRDITTLASLARGLPDGFKPRRGHVDSYVRAYEQARIQLDSRGKVPPLFELREIVETQDEGLCRLPEPSWRSVSASACRAILRYSSQPP